VANADAASANAATPATIVFEITLRMSPSNELDPQGAGQIAPALPALV